MPYSMKCYHTDSENSDIVIENGSSVLIDGMEELKQALYLEIGTNLKTWYLGVDYGTAWKQRDESGIFDVRLKNLSYVEAEISRVVYKRKEVKKITDIQSQMSDRKISMTIFIQTDFGNTSLQINV